MITAERPRCECHDCTQVRYILPDGPHRISWKTSLDGAISHERERCVKIVQEFMEDYMRRNLDSRKSYNRPLESEEAIEVRMETLYEIMRRIRSGG